MSMDTKAEDKSLGELFADLTRESSQLVRQEVALAKAEMSQKAAAVGKDAGFIAAGGFLAYAAFLTLIAAAVIGLGHLVGYAVSALIVTVVLGGVGAALAMTGLKGLKKVDPLPKQTIETLKDDVQALKGSH